MSHGSGIANESIGDPACIPWQNLINLSGSLNIIFWTISHLWSLYFGSTSYPKFSNTLLDSTAVLSADATTDGAKNIPWSIDLFIPRVGPTSLPSPGSVNLSPARSIRSFLPAIYAPFGAIPPPKFFIKDPTIISAPTSIGVLSSTNSQ